MSEMDVRELKDLVYSTKITTNSNYRIVGPTARSQVRNIKSEIRVDDVADGEIALTGTSGYPDRPTFSEDFVVSVTNQSASTASGGADAEGDTGDSAEVGV